MRCSKCQYISFDNSDRCRNCGYEFSLAVDIDPLDLPIRTGEEPSGPLADFSLADLDMPEPPPAAPAPRQPEPPSQRQAPAPPLRSAPSGELPLFRDRGRDDDAPLVSLPASPRAPVAVRKSTIAQRPPQRPTVHEPELDLDADDDETDKPPLVSYRSAPQTVASRTGLAEGTTEVAPLVPRVLAAAIDLSLLVAIDTVVLYLTLKLCGLEFGDVALIPLTPFVAFIAFLNGGYVAAFTAAGGQTIGKMLTGIKVVNSEEGAWSDRVPVGPSAVRALGYLLSALPAGLGFLPVLVGAERRGLHDRLAHTRVVKA